MTIKEKLQDWLLEDNVKYFDERLLKLSERDETIVEAIQELDEYVDDRMDMLAQLAHDDKRLTETDIDSSFKGLAKLQVELDFLLSQWHCPIPLAETRRKIRSGSEVHIMTTSGSTLPVTLTEDETLVVNAHDTHGLRSLEDPSTWITLGLLNELLGEAIAVQKPEEPGKGYMSYSSNDPRGTPEWIKVGLASSEEEDA